MKLVQDDKKQLNLQESLDSNFLEIWTLFLEQNVARQKIMVELAGSPTRACIAQAVYWHELLLLAEAGSRHLMIKLYKTSKQKKKIWMLTYGTKS